MARPRDSNKALTDSRVYQKGARLYYFAPFPMRHPTTGKLARWHPVGSVSDGIRKAVALAEKIRDFNTGQKGPGDMPAHVEIWRAEAAAKREPRRPREPARAAMFDRRGAELDRIARAIGDAFRDFDVAQVEPVDVATFLDQWAGQRSAQTYKAGLSKFMTWAVRKGYRADNPTREVSTEPPKKRRRLITDREFLAIREALLIGLDGRPTASGPRVRALVDLCYLTLQRPTEARLLKWADVDTSDTGHVTFRPTKTEESTGGAVRFKMTPDIQAVLRVVAPAGRVRSMYVFTALDGQPYTASGLRSAWARACERAKVEDATLRDIRPKAVTDAKRAGYDLEELKVAAVHSDAAMTAHYDRSEDIPTTAVVMRLPV